MKQLNLLLVLLVCLSTIFVADSLGQAVTFKIIDKAKKPLPSATVQLFKVSDSTMVYASTNKKGCW